MEILTIKKQTFEEMLERLNFFAKQVELLCNKYSDKSMNQWLDSQDACSILNIKPRTLQTYRDTGKISFSQTSHKIYYKPSDVNKFLKENSINAKIKNYEDHR